VRSRTWPIMKKEFIEIWRDRRSLAFVLSMPVFMLLLYGYGISSDVKRVPLAVYDRDGQPPARELVRRFTSTDYFVVTAQVGSLWELRRAIDLGVAKVGLTIPEDFSQNLGAGRPAPIQFVVDGSDSNTANIAIGNIASIGKSIELSPRDLRPHILVTPKLETPVPIELRTWVWYNPELKSSNFLVPGLTAVILMMLAAMLTSLTVAREWEQGTMEQLVATPIRVPELVLGKLLPYFGIGLLDIALAALVGTLVFGVPFRGSPALLLGLSLIFLLGAMTLGILISIKARSQVLASQVALTVTFLPAFLLSGFVFDLGNLPGWLQAISHVVPARYFVTILKGIFLKGVGLRTLAPEAGFLALFALLVTLAANRSFRKSLE